ncbi:restriction endonuclease subunit S [Algoriphagus aquimarinus]|uniref:Restriction endonuclease subunit S n=1 Tax=Algoriphagus aquimarinus TaxID=237018 RepID=A0A5C7AGX9_9BACT|nr:restriction endonuclease subunit S [Algoriphagus aquimarinus]TXE07587.1 restriction endonuclease subunit S [Algoriphagus aquimarinus]
MSEWEEIGIGELATFRNGAGIKQEYFSDRGVKLARVSDFTDDSIDISKCNFVSKEHAIKWKSHFLNEGDVVVATVGSWPPNWSSAVGKVIRIPKALGDLIQNQNTCCIIPDNTKLDNRFLFYILRTIEFRWFAGNSAGGSANQARLPVAKLKQFKTLLPPLPEQKAIAHILGKLDDKIELNRQMNQTLEAMAQALFKSWFVDFDPVLDNTLAAGNDIPNELLEMAEKRALVPHSKKLISKAPELAAKFPSSFVFNETLGKWIPEGWEVKSVENAIHVNPSVSIKKGEVRKYVDMKALPTSGYSIDGFIEKGYSGGAKFKQGDVLLARITPCLENGKTAIVDFLKSDEAGFGSTEFIILRGKNQIKTPFVACLARFEAFVNHCIQNMVGSSGRQRVQNSCFNSYFLALPDHELLKKFDLLSKPNFNKITDNSNEIETLTQLRDMLLPELISGRVRVKEEIL